MDQMEWECVERLVVIRPERLPASSNNSLVGGRRGECQTVTRDDVSPEVAATFHFFSKHFVRQHLISKKLWIVIGAA